MAGRCNSCGNPTIDELIEAILTRMICEREGLDVDEARRCLRVILAPGGNLEFDQFGRLRSTCCDGGEPQPAACVRTVADLPEFIIAGQGGGGALIHPYGSPQGIDYAIDHGLDMISNLTWSTTDDVAVWGIYGPDVLLRGYTDTPSSTEIGAGASSSDWAGLLVDAGTRESPTGEGAYAPEQFKTPYGGWYGFFAPQYHPLTLANAMRNISRRVVTWADITASEADPSANQRSVVAALAGVAAVCNAESTILSVETGMAEYVETIANAQITPALVVRSTTFTPQMALDAGVEWVRLSGNWTAGQIQPYVDAGLQVMLFTNSRHHITQKALDVGARGIMAWDPVYARGPVDPVYLYYRRPRVRYVLRRTEIGMLTKFTDQLSLISGRPYMKSTEYGMGIWVTDDRVRNAPLIGAACPLPSPEDDSYTWECQVDQASLPDGDGPKIGVIYGGTTDVDPTELEGPHVGYACYIRVGTEETGFLEIGRYDADGAYEVLATSSTSRAVGPNDWMSFRLEVTATTITLTRTDGTPYSVTATDSAYRGPYVHWMCNSTPPDGRFAAVVREFTVASTSGGASTESATVATSRPVLPESAEGF